MSAEKHPGWQPFEEWEPSITNCLILIADRQRPQDRSRWRVLFALHYLQEDDLPISFIRMPMPATSFARYPEHHIVTQGPKSIDVLHRALEYMNRGESDE